MCRHDLPCVSGEQTGQAAVFIRQPANSSEKYTEVVGEQRALVEQDFAGDDLELLATLDATQT